MVYFKNKILYWCVALAAILYCYVEAQGLGDFYIFMSAASGLSTHLSIYQVKFVDGYNYFYSVLFAVFLRLFYTLPFFWVKFCWLLLNAFLFFHLFRLMASWEGLRQLEKKQRTLFFLLVFVFSFRFLHDNIHTSQITILILWCCIYGLYLIHHQKSVAGSAILALGINIKLLPLVFLPYLVYRGYFKAFVLTLLFYILSLFAPILIVGYDYNMSLLRTWLNLVNPAQERHVLDVDERSFHSLSTLLSTLLVKNVPDLRQLQLQRNIADIPLAALAKVLLAVRAALVFFTLYFLKLKPFVKARSEMDQLVEVSYILLLIPLIFPHQQHYAFLFSVPAFALVLYYLVLNFKTIPAATRRCMIVLMAFIYLTANLKMLLGEFNRYYEHFKILTYGALLLIPLLVWVYRGIHKGSEVPEN